MELSPQEPDNGIRTAKEASAESDVETRIKKEARISAQAQAKFKDTEASANYNHKYLRFFPFLLICVALAAINIFSSSNTLSPVSTSALRLNSPPASSSVHTEVSLLSFPEFQSTLSKTNAPFFLKEFNRNKLEISVGLFNTAIPLNCNEALFKDRCPGLLYLELKASGGIKSAVLILQRPIKNTNGYLKYKGLTAKELESIESFNAQAVEYIMKTFTSKSSALSTWELGEVLSKLTECSELDRSFEKNFEQNDVSIYTTVLGLDQVIIVELAVV